MFTKLKVTQSMVDAVNTVINEKKMSEADLDETGLRKAAYAAHTAGQKMFSFKGKTYPVKVQGEDVSYGEAVKEETNPSKDSMRDKVKQAIAASRLENKAKEMMKAKEAEKRKVKEETEIDEAASGEVTKTKTGLVHRSTKAYGGSKPEKHVVDTLKGPKTKDLIKKDVDDYKKTRGRYDEELKGDQHKIDANKNKKIDAHDFAILRGKKKVKESFSVRLEEKWKSMKEKKDVVMPEALEKSPEKNQDVADKSYLKDKPGSVKSDLKNLGRFITGKKETNEEVEQVDEVKKPTGELKDACWKGYTAVGMKMKGGRKVPNCVPEEVELEEKAGYSAKDARAGKDIGKPGKAFSKIAKSAGERYGSAERGKKVAGAILAKLRKEETEEYTEEQLDEMINEVLGKDATAGDWISDFVHSDNPKFAGKSKAKRKEMALAAYYAKQRNEDVEIDEATIAGTSGWKKMDKDVKDKSGAIHTPMSRAKDLARSAFKKVQDRTKIKK
jgi:hypothetical protein